ncbi:MAG: hypothetical protein WBM32_21900, partial [Crocosphaera sp.]
MLKLRLRSALKQALDFRTQKSEVVFETKIYAPSQKLFAFKGGVLDPIIFDNPKSSWPLRIHRL